MNKMRVMQISHPGGPFELIERDIPQPSKNEVCIKVAACGICHSDFYTKEGRLSKIQYPIVPGHEVTGTIVTLGDGVKNFQLGQRVGIGWHAGYCGLCNSCLHGDFTTCSLGTIPGVTFDGGYAEYMVAPSIALAPIPSTLSFIEAAPLLCAGVTSFNALRHSGARANDIVAIFGIGGLGHLAIQFAKKMGFNTIAISRGQEKMAISKQLGAVCYIDSQVEDPAQALIKLGGAKVILATVTDAKAMSNIIEGLSVDGKLLVVGAPIDKIEVAAASLIVKRRTIAGWPSGMAVDSQETLSFSEKNGVRPLCEVYPLEKAQTAYDRMINNQARFRAVLTMDLS